MDRIRTRTDRKNLDATFCPIRPVADIHRAGDRRGEYFRLYPQRPQRRKSASCFVRILLNSKQVWPAEGWAEVSPNYDTPTHYEIRSLRVSAGDKLRFIVKHNGQNRADPIVWNPVGRHSRPGEQLRIDCASPCGWPINSRAWMIFQPCRHLHRATLRNASRAAPSRSSPPHTVSVVPQNPMRKCCGCSKKLPGTTLVSNFSRSMSDKIGCSARFEPWKHSCAEPAGLAIEFRMPRQEPIDERTIRFQQRASAIANAIKIVERNHRKPLRWMHWGFRR